MFREDIASNLKKGTSSEASSCVWDSTLGSEVPMLGLLFCCHHHEIHNNFCKGPTSHFHFSLAFANYRAGSELTFQRTPIFCDPRHTLMDNHLPRKSIVTGRHVTWI